MSSQATRQQLVRDLYQRTFGAAPTVASRAPGRVNLIGEHTDYNDGFCLPMAVERDCLVVAGPRDDGKLVAISAEQEAEVSAHIDHLSAGLGWFDYVAGCVWILAEDAGISLPGGVSLAVTGNVPLGSGLSSSAALEVATLHALLQLAGEQLPADRIAVLAQAAENRFVGTNCGILDQLSSASGVAGEAMLMDCRTLALSSVPLPTGTAIVIADTGKRRGLVDSAYNERRAQCEAAAKALGVSHLRDVDLHSLRGALASGAIDQDTYRRAKHVVAENGRTEAAAAACRAHDPVALGRLMDESHLDLRDDFEVTCDELDRMTALARALPGCFGARMTGAGFGGCAVALVAAEQAEAFAEQLLAQYQQEFAHAASVFVTAAAAGAGPEAV